MFGWAGFVVPSCLWCAEVFVPGLALYLVFGKNISAVYLFVYLCQFAKIAFDACHPCPLLHFCKWDNLVPIYIALALVLLNWGLTDLGPGVQPLLQGSLGFIVVAVAVLLARGIGQSFLNSKRLPNVFPASGQGVLAQTGASSKGGGVVL